MTLPERLNFVWRLAATGFCFLTFTVMGVLFRLCVCPLVRLLPGSKAERERFARRVVCSSFAAFVWLMQTLRVMEYHVHGKVDRLKNEPLLICANHPTLIDVVLLMSLTQSSTCLVKAALREAFATKGPVTVTGYIANDGGPELVEACREALGAGETLIIFPEGTRSRPGVPARLHHGAACAALAAGKNITPVHITCEPPSLMKGQPWFSIPKRKMRFDITIGDDIDVAPFALVQNERGRPIAARRLTDCLKHRILLG
ncbi:MAG: lysophospholipid acyltransferase family protein [Duodenibacillus sp.]|nr:lysophospholipid acyltransferase family protein [Duodenibacillus sp.]